MRAGELKGLRWKDVDLFERTLTVGRSKTAAGLQVIPLNRDAIAALAELRERAEKLGAAEPEHYVFPSHESDISTLAVRWRVGGRHGGR